MSSISQDTKWATQIFLRLLYSHVESIDHPLSQGGEGAGSLERVQMFQIKLSQVTMKMFGSRNRQKMVPDMFDMTLHFSGPRNRHMVL